MDSKVYVERKMTQNNKHNTKEGRTTLEEATVIKVAYHYGKDRQIGQYNRIREVRLRLTEPNNL